jgi:hypothetical protein
MPRNNPWYNEGTSLTDCLARDWDYRADCIIRDNFHLSNDEIVKLIEADHGCKSAEWVQSRRPLFAGSKKAGAA